MNTLDLNTDSTYEYYMTIMPSPGIVVAAYWNAQKKETKFVNVMDASNILLQPYKVIDYNVNLDPFSVCLSIEDSASVKRLACMGWLTTILTLEILKINMLLTTAVGLKTTIGAQVCEAKLADRPFVSAELDYIFKCPDNNQYVGLISPPVS